MNRLKIPKRVPECGLKSLITWVNSKLRTKLSDISNLSNGAAYCRLINLIHPGIIAGKKIKLDASPARCLSNYKLLQNAFYVLKVDKVIPVEQLIASNQRTLLTFTCWIKVFFEINVSLSSDVSNVSSNKPQNNNSDGVKQVLKASVTSDLQSRPECTKKTQKLESGKNNFSSNDPSIDYFLYQISKDNPPLHSEQVRDQISYLFQDEEEGEFKLESISNVSLREFEALEAMLESSHCTGNSTDPTSYKLDPQKGPSKMFMKEFSFDDAFNQWFEKELNVSGGGENDVIDKNNEERVNNKNYIPPIKLSAEPSINSQTYIQDFDTTKCHHNEHSLQDNTTPDFQNNLQHLLEFQRSSPSKVTQHHFSNSEPLLSHTVDPDVHYTTSASSNTTNMKIDRPENTLREGLSSSSPKIFFQSGHSLPPALEELQQNNNFPVEEFNDTLNCAVLVANGIHENCKLSDNNDYDERLTECIADERKYNFLKLEEENEKTLIF